MTPYRVSQGDERVHLLLVTKRLPIGKSTGLNPLVAELLGALTYWGRDAEGLIAVLRLRLLALHGVQCSAGAGPNRSIAAMAADITPPGAATVVRDDPYEVAVFLRTKPASALPGIGSRTAKTLTRYGITSVGDIADTQLPTLQRIVGTTAARGIDERPVVPGAAPRTMSASRRFDRDELDPDQHHRAVLGLVQDLGGRLRTSGEIAQALTLTVTYADRTQTTRTRTLTEPTAHTPALADTARQLLTELGLQRARVRTLTLRAERLRSAEETVHQLTLDARDDKLRRLETLSTRPPQYRPASPEQHRPSLGPGRGPSTTMGTRPEATGARCGCAVPGAPGGWTAGRRGG
ncbi:hypothetical protein ACFWEB_36665 [Streptomyces parvus]|uniref:DNA polymerase Y family protein n=1 Tax=Streptomyces parvus TaxID=66428 RepID=UPI00365DEE37